MTPIPDPIRNALADGEHPLWWGRPRQGFVLRKSDALAIPLSLLWFGFAIFWEISALRSSAPGLFGVLGVVFVALGIYMVAGRFVVDARQRASTFYAVTPQRVLIVSGPSSRTVNALNLKTLGDLPVTETSGGEGTISFGPKHLFETLFGPAFWPGTRQHAGPCFDLIPHAKSIFETIRDAQRS